MRLSIIVPTLNEAPGIVACLRRLQPLRAAGHEIIVVDAGSTDATCALARPLADSVIPATRGRARQMNAGARQATGDALVFLHADTILPPRAELAVTDALARNATGWGRFDVRLSGSHPMFRVIESLMNLRSRVTGIATGDQAMFVRREAFAAAGGFPDLALMEDVVLSRRLRRHGRPACLCLCVVTSSRRWEQHGIARTIAMMWFLRFAFWIGADPGWLARCYERG